MIAGVRDGGYWTLWPLPPVIVVVEPFERVAAAAFAKEF